MTRKYKHDKQEIQSIADEIIKWAIENDTSMNVFVNNKRYTYEYGNTNVKVEENIDVNDYCYRNKYSNGIENHLITIGSYDLGEYYDMFCECTSLEKLLEKHGLYIEPYNGYYYSVCVEGDDWEDWEYTHYELPKPTTHICGWQITNGDFPWIIPVYETWKTNVLKYGVNGSCVIGDGFSFNYKGDPYFFSTNYNQSDITTPTENAVKKALEDIGATDIYYDCGRLD